MADMEHMDAFRNNFLVVGLPEAVVWQIADLAKYEAYAANDVLIHRGDHSGDLLVVLEGNVGVYTDKNDRLATVGPGGILGEIALVDAQPRSADVVATGLTKVARLPANELRAYMAANKDAGFIMLANLARILSMRLRNAQVVLEELKEKASQDPWKFAT